MHEKLAELFAREVERVTMLHAKGLAGTDQLALVRLYTARERHHAGLPIGDAEGRSYEQMRSAYLQEVKRRHRLLIDAGLGHKEHMDLEFLDLQREFPPVADTDAEVEDRGAPVADPAK